MQWDARLAMGGALACVVSSLYLKDAWSHAFSKEDTERRPFHAPDGDVDADFMVNEVVLELMDTEIGTVVGYPLSNGATMLLLLPREGLALDEVLEDGSGVAAMERFDPADVDVELHLPKFESETIVDDMIPMLKAAGFASAASPDLKPMTGGEEALAAYVHGSKVAIDEDGLEAGAYFVMAACAGAAPDFWEPPTPRVIELDRPFLYGIVSRTGQPLFLGAVTRPEADPLAWLPFRSEGEVGEGGRWVARDEEIPGACRITLECDDDTASYSIVCRVRGAVVHTAGADGYEAALARYAGMREDLAQCAAHLADDSLDIAAWCDGFSRRW